MPTIYATISDEIIRKCKTPDFSEYLNALFILYSSKDFNKNKENLLTIYLNSSDDCKYLSLFTEQGYKLQPEKLKDSTVLDKIIINFINNDDIDGLLKILPNVINPCYTLLCLPTKYRFNLFKKTYQKNNIFYDKKTDLIKDIFRYGKINCEDTKECESCINDLFEIFQTIYSNNGLKNEHMELLTHRVVMDNFLNQILNFKKRVDIEEETNVNLIKNNNSRFYYEYAHFNVTFDFDTIKKLDTFSHAVLLDMKLKILSSRKTEHKPNKLNKI